MAAPNLHIKTGASTWKVVNNIYVKTGASTWKQILNAYIKTGVSTWKRFYQAVDYTLKLSAFTDSNTRPTVGECFAACRLTTNGDVSSCNSQATLYTPVTDEWIHESAKGIVDSSLYEARMSSLNTSGLGSGSININFPDNTNFHSLSAQRELRIRRTTVGTSTVTATLEVREIANPSNTTGPVTVTLTTIVESGA